MDWKFWLPLGVNLICMWLAFKQVQLMKPQIEAPSSAKTSRPFWPLLIMVMLVIAVWIPYLIGLGSTQLNPHNLILQWGTQENSCDVAIDGNRLLKFKEQFGVAFTCHLENTDIDEFEDRRISISQIFSIRPGVIEMKAIFSKEMIDEIGARKKSAELAGVRQATISIKNHILLLPRAINTDDIKKLSDVQRFGGKVVTNQDWLFN